ncbi:SAM-dependent methyltransferase [Bordetella avium]|uniref:SAM-dependent methyltransferase n=1 Tax=Bordetella avium TaxID=521 RepID=UPI000E0A335B|nr:SAM-dependent methyltransferase [Bordetella avium]AZY51990.1 SAM-dependent methyltransferase [Bordetella avium]RIQ13917.1 SAM-dependent methyltransferase [Bordetella avium]RIQ17008.1 SAM-dependent methyltransferase [Bordetella avium]RIQ36265.1 SAM-dependent methyltransferase [Bordetella avium]RIQ39614.1 SAM-dependent methyltransferase [Bordetella avium]
MTGALHLIPVGLGEAPIECWLPTEVRALAGRLDCYIAENAKTARAFLKTVSTERPLQEITIHTLNDQADDRQIEAWLAPIKAGKDIGLISEAGCPAVADPGAKVAAAAHRLGHTVKPWVGPSSILLGLMASGLDGQRFAFHGYAPVDATERAKQLRTWEQHSAKHDQTQMLIETPYRNTAMFNTLLSALKGDTRLCLARSLTTSQEWVATKTIAQWKQTPAPDLDKQPTLFLFLAR